MFSTRRNVASSVIAAAIAVVATVGIAAPAEAAKSDCDTANAFCGFNNADWTGMFVESNYTGNGTVDITDNVLSAGWNKQSRKWCAVASGIGSSIVFEFAPSTAVTNMGSANDKADFMWPKGAGTCA